MLFTAGFLIEHPHVCPRDPTAFPDQALRLLWLGARDQGGRDCASVRAEHRERAGGAPNHVFEEGFGALCDVMGSDGVGSRSTCSD
jgi:hypothetical protein